MKEQDILRIQQLEAALAPFRHLLTAALPAGGWINAVRAALGISKVQLARRLGRKSSQTVEDLLNSEARGTIQLNSLNELAAALDCRLVYAVVPNRPLSEIRRQQAHKVARNMLERSAHSMRLEDQGLSAEAHQRALDRLAEHLLDGSSRTLWK